MKKLIQKISFQANQAGPSHDVPQFLNVVCPTISQLEISDLVKGFKYVRLLLFYRDFSKFSDQEIDNLLKKLFGIGKIIALSYVGISSEYIWKRMFVNDLDCDNMSNVYDEDEVDFEWALSSFIQGTIEYQKLPKSEVCTFIVYEDMELINYFTKHHHDWPIIIINNF